MDQSRLRRLRRKRLLLATTMYIPLAALWISGEYTGISWGSLICLYVASLFALNEILFRWFGNENLLQVLSPELRELEDYEVSNLNKESVGRSKNSSKINYILIVICLAIAYLLRDHLKFYGNTDYLFPIFIFGVQAFLSFRRGMVEDRKLDRAVQQDSEQESTESLTHIEPKKIHMSVKKLNQMRLVNTLLFTGTILLLAPIYFFLASWIHSDAVFFLTFALLPFTFVVTYLTKGRLNTYSLFVPLLRDHTEWKKEELQEDWNVYQRWGFIVSVILLVSLLVLAYSHIGSHLDAHVDQNDMIELVVNFFFYSIIAGITFYFFGRRADRSLLPLEEDEKDEDEDEQR